MPLYDETGLKLWNFLTTHFLLGRNLSINHCRVSYKYSCGHYYSTNMIIYIQIM
jgi:hypothetical protein